MRNGFLNRLDVYATDEPGFHEGHPEDRCPLCEWPVCDHPGRATWPHRRAAAFAMFVNRFTCCS